LRIRTVKALVVATALGPVAWLLHAAFTGGLGANPIDKITDETGTWTLRLLLATLAVTPLRRLTGWNEVIRVRRLLGLAAFSYGSLHFLTYVVLDQFFAFDLMAKDVVKRPFITVGFTGFVLMVPLAVTSTAGWVRRLGGRRWARLHRLVYVSAAAGVVHYYWLVKADTSRPVRYGVVLATLLGLRATLAWRGASARGGAPVNPSRPGAGGRPAGGRHP